MCHNVSLMYHIMTWPYSWQADWYTGRSWLEQEIAQYWWYGMICQMNYMHSNHVPYLQYIRNASQWYNIMWLWKLCWKYKAECLGGFGDANKQDITQSLTLHMLNDSVTPFVILSCHSTNLPRSLSSPHLSYTSGSVKHAWCYVINVQATSGGGCTIWLDIDWSQQRYIIVHARHHLISIGSIS